jgi:DNA-binding NarL/FixJ family response regulator
MMEQPITILLADDHPLIRAGIRSILAAEEDLHLIAEAINGYEVQSMAAELQPDVISLDLRMPGPPPSEVIAQVRQQSPDTKILVVTAYYDEASIRELVVSGANGFLLKDETSDKLVLAIRTVAKDGYWFSPLAVSKLIDLDPDNTSQALKRSLTPREREILGLVGKGWKNNQIARQLELSPQTVRNYISRIYSKLGVRSRTEAVAWAKEQGVSTTLPNN